MAQTPNLSVNLALAVVSTSDAPLLLLDSELGVLAASSSFCRAFEVDLSTMVGHRFPELGDGEWRVPQLESLLAATASGFAEVAAYEMDLVREGRDSRRLVVNAHKLNYGDEDHVRLLLSVSDVTTARAAERIRDDLLREKAILLQEIQHRVANSLQIIASVLMQSARKVQSEETRLHLRAAHERIISVAEVQRQLSASSIDAVALRPYFSVLCRSLAASMIRDPEQVQLLVNIDDSSVAPDVSISLGLIVTELVINALKHAFPNDQRGKILVDFHAHGSQWALTVRDTGIGMPQHPDIAKPGLGTSIIEALAKQQHARITVTSVHPGTEVVVMHPHIAVVEDVSGTQESRAV